MGYSLGDEEAFPPSQDWVRTELEGHFYQNRLRVRFVGEIEQRYRRYCARRDRRYIRNLLNVLIFLYVLYGACDWLLLQEAVSQIWIVRYCVGLPGLLLLWFITRFARVERYIDKLVVVCLLWLSVTSLVMARLAPTGVVDLYMSSVLVIVMVGMTVTRMRFWHAVVTGLLFILAVLILLPSVHINSRYLFYYIMLSSGVVLVCLFAQYSADRAGRREFLQKIIIHRKNRQLRKTNLNLRDLAEVDSLTGIANRRFFDSVLDEELRRARRREYSVALLMCDIDYFKAYNDLLGHLEGDSCLRAVAQAIKHQVRRPGDLVARYGGEEFAVILPALDVTEAQNIAEMICERVAALKIPHSGSRAASFVTISVGVSALVPREDNCQKKLINQADEALYQAKNQGRNRVCVYSGERD